MAKTRKKPTKEEVKPESAVLDPQRVHELFNLVGPYDPPAEPIPTRNFVSYWGPGLSINELRRRRKELFSHPAWLDGQAFAKLSDSWRWRQINLTPAGLDEPFDSKTPDLPLARELVVYLALHLLAIGERLEIPRLRCRDVLPSGRRVCVGPWHDGGLEIANVSDRWKSPRMGYCTLYTPIMPRRK